MPRTTEDLAAAAQAAGAELVSTHLVQLADGSWTLAGQFRFEDPWAAARLLCILAEQDAAEDDEVAAWGRDILEETADQVDLSPDDPAIGDAFVRNVHANVQHFIRFEPEQGERFQSARTTLINGVGDCDCQARLVHALVRGQGFDSEIRFFEQDGEPVHAVSAVAATGAPLQWAETTIGALFGEHPQVAYRRLGLDQVDARPDIGAGPTRDDVVAMQTRLEDLSLATSLAVESCHALSSAQIAQWDNLASRILAYDSTDPGSADLAAGQALESELVAWGDTLRAAGCAAPVPAPAPRPAAPPASNNPFEGLASAMAKPLQAVAITVGLVAGAIVTVKVLDAMGPRRASA